MMNKAKDTPERTKAFALRIIRLYTALPKSTEAQVIGKQVLRSGTSVGAHVRERLGNLKGLLGLTFNSLREVMV